jgi:SAM-dependent methyltransferase
MLTKAREFSPSESGVPIEWREGDAATLPFDDSTFDLVLCSQGLQYFPDRNAALREMRRALVAGGRLVLCVWGLMQGNPFQFAVNDSLKSRLGVELSGGFSLGNADEVGGLITGAGFRNVDVRPTIKTASLLPPEETVPGFLASISVAETVAALSDNGRAELYNDIITALGSYVTEKGMTVPGKVLFAKGRN